MKAISLIWILSMLLLGFVPGKHVASPELVSDTESCMEQNCCGQGCCCLPEDNGGDQESPDEKKSCGDNCQCDATAQFQALFIPENAGQMRSVGLAGFGIWTNQYHFEYKAPLFEPPRLV